MVAISWSVGGTGELFYCRALLIIFALIVRREAKSGPANEIFDWPFQWKLTNACISDIPSISSIFGFELTYIAYNTELALVWFS